MHSRDEAGVTPLMCAVDGQHLETTRALLRCGASGALADVELRSSLTRAVDIILTSGPRSRQGFQGMMDPRGDVDHWLDLCRVMVEQAADVNIVDAKGDSLLSRAVRYQRNDVVQALLELGASCDLPVPALCGGPALLRAVNSRQMNLCRTLVMRAASVNMPTAEGVTPLCAAIDKGHEELCFYLLQSGARYDLRDPRTGETMVMKAAAHGLAQLYDHLRPHVPVTALGDDAFTATDAGEDGAEYEYVSEGSEQ